MQVILYTDLAYVVIGRTSHKQGRHWGLCGENAPWICRKMRWRWIKMLLKFALWRAIGYRPFEHHFAVCNKSYIL